MHFLLSTLKQMQCFTFYELFSTSTLVTGNASIYLLFTDTSDLRLETVKFLEAWQFGGPFVSFYCRWSMEDIRVVWAFLQLSLT